MTESYTSAPAQNSSNRLPQQRLPCPDPRAILHIGSELKVLRRQHDDGRAVLEPAEFVTLLHLSVARKHRRPPALRIEGHIEEMQPDAGDQNGGDWYQR